MSDAKEIGRKSPEQERLDAQNQQKRAIYVPFILKPELRVCALSDQDRRWTGLLLFDFLR